MGSNVTIERVLDRLAKDYRNAARRHKRQNTAFFTSDSIQRDKACDAINEINRVIAQLEARNDK